MGYVEDTLGSGETIEYDVSFHWLWTFSAYTIFVILVAAALGLFLLFSPMTSVEGIEPMIRLLPSLVLAVIGLVIFLYMMIIEKCLAVKILILFSRVQKFPQLPGKKWVTPLGAGLKRLGTEPENGPRRPDLSSCQDLPLMLQVPQSQTIIKDQPVPTDSWVQE